MLKKRLGTEAIESDWYSDEKLTNYFKIPSTLIIPEGCEFVGTWTFYFCDNIEKIVIPDSCWKIGYAAFYGCERLKKVEIPKSVEKIREHAFCGCINATIILRKRKKDFKFGIGSEAFYDVKDVKEEIRS